MSISDICRTITSLQMKENPVMNFDGLRLPLLVIAGEGM